jgi:hypothetical protein
MLRCLKTGTAYVRYFDASGARETFLLVPRVTECSVADDEFVALHGRVLSESPSVSPSDAARAHVAGQDRALVEEANAARITAEPESPAGYRIKKKRAPKEKQTT